MGIFVLNQIITSSLLIIIIMLIRAIVGHRMSQRLRYGLWLIVLIKLIIPLPVTNSLNIVSLVDSFGANALEVTDGASDISEDIAKADTDNTPQGTYNISDKNSTYTSSGYSDDKINATDSYEASHFNIPGEANVSGSDGAISSYNNYSISQNNKPDYNKNTGVYAQGSGPASVLTKALALLSKYGLYIFIIWLIGAMVVGALLIISNVLFLSRLKKSRRLIKKYNKLNVYESNVVSGPCLAGLFSPAIYLPNEEYLIRTYSDYILLHEWTHYRHFDLMWAALRGVVLILYWFNPLVWGAASLSIKDSELACDEGVLSVTGETEHKSYGKMLIDICESVPVRARRLQPTQATQMLGGSREMKERIKNIASYTKHSTVILICAVIVAAIAVGCTYGQGTENISQESSDTSDAASDNSFVSGSAVSKTDENEETDYNSIYEEFVQRLAAETIDGGVYYSVIDLETPVLLVSDSVINDYGGFTSSAADVYMYVEGEHAVVKLTEAHSTGSGYPLIFSDGYIISGLHHESERINVENGELIKESAEGFYTDNKYGYHSIDVFNYYSTVRTVEEKLDINKIEEMDYYGLSFDKAGAYNITFKAADPYALYESVPDKLIEGEKPELKQIFSYTYPELSGEWKKYINSDITIYSYIYSLKNDEGIEHTDGMSFVYKNNKFIAYEFYRDMRFLSNYLAEGGKISDIEWAKDNDVMELSTLTMRFIEMFAKNHDVIEADSKAQAEKIKDNNLVIYPVALTDEDWKYLYSNDVTDYVAFSDTDGGSYIWENNHDIIMEYLAPAEDAVKTDYSSSIDGAKNSGVYMVDYIADDGIFYHDAYLYKDVFPGEDTGNSIGIGDEHSFELSDDVKFYLLAAPTSENENMRLENVSKKKFKSYQEKYYHSQEAYSYGIKYYKGMLCIIELDKDGRAAKVKQMYQE